MIGDLTSGYMIAPADANTRGRLAAAAAKAACRSMGSIEIKMRSGLYNYTAAPEFAESLGHEPTKVWTPEEVLAVAFERPPLFAPGKEFDYCNTNYVLLGLIAEKVEGEALARIFQNRLFGPLGMKDTSLPANTSNTIPEPYSHGYMYGSSSYALVDAPYPADLQAAAKAGTLKPNDDTRQSPSYALAAGGRRRLYRG
jgi:D-alanyl-D-alanine carboxypeptidase